VAKQKFSISGLEADLPFIPGDEEIRELDELSQNSLPNKDEIVNLFSKAKNRTVSICRGDVYKQAAVMTNNNVLSHLYGIDRKTLVKHFARELEMARAYGRQKLMTRFYHLALNNNNPAYMIFALKNFAQMSDAGLTENLEEIDEGVEFKVKRPTKPIEKIIETTTSLEYEDALIDIEDLE
jgi:hypothetical protein